MRKLNETQKEFILETFFVESCAGWKTIGTDLIENGECIVAGTTRIWIGGVGNFITIEPAIGTVGCSLYKFDLESFLSSDSFKETVELKYQDLSMELNETTKVINDITEKLQSLILLTK